MSSFLFGNSASSQMLQTPGQQAGGQHLTNLIGQPDYGFSIDEKAISDTFGQKRRDAEEQSVGSFQDMGLKGLRQGTLMKSLAQIQSRSGVNEAKYLSDKRQQWKTNVLNKTPTGGTAVSTPSSPGLIGSFAAGAGSGAASRIG